METFNHKLNTFLESWMGPRDQRVRGWLLLDNYPPTFALTVMYLLIVWMGPKYMKHRQPYSSRGLLVLYNLGLTLLSFYMFYELVTAVWHGGYNFYCQDTHSAQEVDNKIINVLWWYYFSKLIEFMDTFFFILRKNNHQITFLHIYHHASMLNIWWFVMNWVPCGHSYFGASLNSFVHVVMYSYYGLSAIPAMRPYLWWKKYITQLQLIQFFLTMSQTMCAVIWPCDFPKGWLYFQISYMVVLVFLFSNFYIQTYKKHSGSLKKEHQNGSPVSTNGHANGTASMERTEHKKLRVD
ncbi:very long chain fatty acid elongase 5 [Cottoperca gobio]|uniref:Elongation of very long chain fatty acids protein 5 n=1 Tax=Cottoperca gobio TaxID=56716 RepID=A0A6J2R8C5_COTGO|nr:elongation of very long chain fatty acids protein 5 [Cottoperca gobio]XP_029305588.1 elongation of very long chain fatty acids protein 5 [Cottoperca gobio]XP_029305589.1 elongation of very long chain fatty acids protein 5 [Cottoperca gobio]XP_029305590.1 elongation of very long chain fatty acids protein 5 [Cottoperca gobio]